MRFLDHSRTACGEPSLDRDAHMRTRPPRGRSDRPGSHTRFAAHPPIQSCIWNDRSEIKRFEAITNKTSNIYGNYFQTQPYGLFH